MKVAILAAGIGSRLRPLTDKIPKTMIKIMDQTIISRLIFALKENGISDITIVTGYKHATLVAHLEETFPEDSFFYIYNPNYHTMNNIYSFYLLMPYFLGHTMLVINSDLFCDWALIEKAVKSPYNTIVVDDKVLMDEEATKVQIGEDGFISRISKDLIPAESCGESIGIIKIFKDKVCSIFEQVALIIKQGDTQIWYPYALNEVLEELQLKPIFTEGLNWVEIDTIEDYQRAIKMNPVLGW